MQDTSFGTRSTTRHDDRAWDRPDRDLVTEALAVLGDNDAGDLDAEDLTWCRVPDLDVSTLLECISDGDMHGRRPIECWRDWFEGELEIDRDEFDGGRGWASLATEKVREPVIVTIEPGRVQIWDGWHRVGGTIVSGRASIAAIVGTPRRQATS